MRWKEFLKSLEERIREREERRILYGMTIIVQDLLKVMNKKNDPYRDVEYLLGDLMNKLSNKICDYKLKKYKEKRG